MSRTRASEQVESPVSATIFFNGESGRFGRMGENKDEGIIDVPLPLRFVVLDAGAHRVTGKRGLEKDAPRFRSTLAHESRTTKLRVWMEGRPNETVAEGTWGSMKEALYPHGARYTRCIYAICDFGVGKETACIQLHGRALSAWMDYVKASGVKPESDIAFSVKEVAEMAGSKGRPSLVPVFSHGQISQETAEAAKAADEDLQAWLDVVFSEGGAGNGLPPSLWGSQSPDAEQPFPEFEPAETGDDLPF